MAEDPTETSDAAKKMKRDASSATPDLAAAHEALWEASALSPANGVPEEALSPGVRAALEQLFPAERRGLGVWLSRAPRTAPSRQATQEKDLRRWRNAMA